MVADAHLIAQKPGISKSGFWVPASSRILSKELARRVRARGLQAQSSKHQVPSSRETPSPKAQAPKSPWPPVRFRVGAWTLELIWSLELGAWSFAARHSSPRGAGSHGFTRPTPQRPTCGMGTSQNRCRGPRHPTALAQSGLITKALRDPRRLGTPDASAWTTNTSLPARRPMRGGPVLALRRR